jgi:hypothetical protein
VTEETQKEQTTVRIEAALLQAIRLESAKKPRLTLTDAIDQGLRFVLAQRTGRVAAPEPSILDNLTPAQRALVTRYAELLRSGHADRHYMDSIRYLIEMAPAAAPAKTRSAT